MSDWTEGYMTNVPYTYGYYGELNPLRMKLAFLDSGSVFPDVANACELGFGQGISINIHAAASSVKWYGTDFNPSHASFAQEMALSGETGAVVYDQSFEEFCKRDDLPEFDYIGLHGIWAWISDENRKLITDFVRIKLKPGGVLYISYNTMPGWSSFAPIRHLMSIHSDFFSAEGNGVINNVKGTIDFAKKLLDTDPLYLKSSPRIKDRLKHVSTQDLNYVTHEYFNEHWYPMYFKEMADCLGSAKMTYACSATYFDHVDAINLTQAHQAFLKGVGDNVFRESIRDFMVNQQFRRDYWVKGVRRIGPYERVELLRSQIVILVQNRGDVSLKVKGALGEAQMQESVYGPVLDYLSNHQPRTIGQIEKAVAGQGINFSQILQSVIILAGAGVLFQAQDAATASRVRKKTEKINSRIMNMSRSSLDLKYLASPLTGGGVSVSRIQQLFLLSLTHGKRNAAELAGFAWQVLSSQNQRLTKDGKVIESQEENMAELTSQAKVFIEKNLPVFRVLQIV